MRAFDIGRRLGLDDLKMLRANGFEAVLPYIDPFNEKGADAQYLRDIAAAGLKVGGFFYETIGGPAGYFTRNQGRQDAWQAERILEGFRRDGLVPDQVIVWYADDTHLAPPSLFDEYANGIEEIASTHQIPGLYGWQDLREWAVANYPNMGKHIAQTYGQDDPGIDLWQHEQITVAGITVDVDEVRVPGWVPGGGSMTTPIYEGQSAPVVTAKKGEVVTVSGIWNYGGSIGSRAVAKKLVGYEVKQRTVEFYPPADPDADQTEVMSAEPALFIFAVTDL